MKLPVQNRQQPLLVIAIEWLHLFSVTVTRAVCAVTTVITRWMRYRLEAYRPMINAMLATTESIASRGH